MVVTLSALGAQPSYDWLIVPGNRIGPITATTSHTDLIRLFGKGNVEDKPMDTGDGPEPATVVFDGQVSKNLVILFKDDRITDVLVCYVGNGPCKWHTASGVTVGTGIRRLEELNGAPFVAEPWGSDVGGNITSWQQGKLAGEFGDGGKFKILLALDFQSAPSGYSSEQRVAVDEFNKRKQALSSDPAMRRLRPTVSRITVFF